MSDQMEIEKKAEEKKNQPRLSLVFPDFRVEIRSSL